MDKALTTRAEVFVVQLSGWGGREEEEEEGRTAAQPAFACALLFKVAKYPFPCSSCQIWHCCDTAKPAQKASFYVSFHFNQAAFACSLEKAVPRVVCCPAQLDHFCILDTVSASLAVPALCCLCHPSNCTKRIDKRPQSVRINSREAGGGKIQQMSHQWGLVLC